MLPGTEITLTTTEGGSGDLYSWTWPLNKPDWLIAEEREENTHTHTHKL